MDTDSQLLRCYHEERSQPAFTRLVQRHACLVYSVALRRVGGDSHLAEDVVQKVFCELARKASTLTDRPTIAGWLYTSAHLASAGVARSEQRRKTRETAAQLMQTTLSSPESDADWTQLRPILDDIIVALKDEEREAIALRFFEKRSFADVGAALRITEEAARKRVDRVLEKLRTLLSRRGVTSTAAALSLTLGAMSSASVSAEFTAKIALRALAHSGVSPGASLVSTLLPVAAALTIGGFFITSQRYSNQELRAEIVRLTVENREVAANLATNRQSVRSLVKAGNIQRTPSVVDATTAEDRLISARIAITPEKTVIWNQDRITLDEFIGRLGQLRAAAEAESRIHIQAAGADFSALKYMIDEVRKAQISHVTIESDAAPGSKITPAWF